MFVSQMLFRLYVYTLHEGTLLEFSFKRLAGIIFYRVSPGKALLRNWPRLW